ncbi:Aste57867_21355 [Aphanomyces stellatus]|uniref:Aste57867_21355 protein n=1 Tax=Aphanomyces stellatus TaxID=120398 RepID=A0A485LIL0_9STRA|nr:hypothetical protein As57867_021286 [Aphanomyces stellatus]VFT98027.1 Aste57867_21355 [Aphanomyces stellatus]
MMWTSMLGLPEPILRQSEAEKRLGVEETRRAAQAFHRASGHGQMTKQVFVHSVLREVLPNMPVVLGDRLFGSINVDLSGNLKYREFISTVAVVKKGVPKEQLKLVFRLLDAAEAGVVTRKDVHTMLPWMAQVDDVAAVAHNGTSWTAAELEAKLFLKQDKLKLDTFRSRVLGLPCKSTVFLDWIRALATAMTFKDQASLPTSPATAAAATGTSDALATAPSCVDSLGLFRGVSLSTEQTKTIVAEFHLLREKFHHDTIPFEDIHSSFASIFPSAVLEKLRPAHAPTLRDWMLQLAFVSNRSMLEGLRFLYDLFAETPSSADLADVLFFLLPSPMYLLSPDDALPAPLPATVAQLVAQLTACHDLKSTKATFDQLFAWLTTDQPALVHALHQLCNTVHIRMMAQERPPVDVQYRLVHAMLHFYSPKTPGVPGQAWAAVDAAWWTLFTTQDASHAVGKLLRALGPESTPIQGLTLAAGVSNRHALQIFVNRATWHALAQWYPPADDVSVVLRVTDDCRHLELSPLTLTLLTYVDRLAVVIGGPSPQPLVVSRRTPVELFPAIVATAAPPSTLSTAHAALPLVFRPAAASTEKGGWQPWHTTTPSATIGGLDLPGRIDVRYVLSANEGADEGAAAAAAATATVPQVVGLSNLGNSCFMNAVLQCLFHSTLLQDYFVSDEYLYDLNVTNTFGMQGVFAAVYGDLARAMASNRARPIAPQTFKAAIGKLYPLFHGHMQHDAHEFLSVLLTGLSEDLSRPLTNYSSGSKPYVEVADSDGRDDGIVAKEWWNAHVLREPSVVTALFSGQFKGSLACPGCGKTGNRFEPFSFLQVPLPQEPTRFLTVYLHVMHQILKLKVRLTNTAGTAELYDCIEALVPEVTKGRLVAVVVQGCKVHSMVQPKQMLVDITQEIHVYHFGESDVVAHSPKQWWQCVYRRQRMVPFYFLEPFRLQVYSIPFLLPSQPFNGHSLYTWVQRQQPPAPPVAANKEKDRSLYFAIPSVHSSWPFTLRYVRAADGLACSRCPWTAQCTGCPVSASESDEIVLHTNEMLALDWGIEAFATQAAYQEIVPHHSYLEFHATPPPSHTLEECIGMLCSSETVDMYCGSCEKAFQHTKSLSLYSAPPILIVQLKRFQAVSEVQSIKADNAIRFPLTLDLGPFLSQPSVKTDDEEETPESPATTSSEASAPASTTFQWRDNIGVDFPYPTAATSADNSQSYDLYGIVCHFGVMGAGHYVAYVQDQSRRWWCVDDMTVTVVAELNVSKLMQSAYLLFYLREDMRDQSMAAWFPRQPNGSIRVDVEEIRKQVHTWEQPGQKPKTKSLLGWTWKP